MSVNILDTVVYGLSWILFSLNTIGIDLNDPSTGNYIVMFNCAIFLLGSSDQNVF